MPKLSVNETPYVTGIGVLMGVVSRPQLDAIREASGG